MKILFICKLFIIKIREYNYLKPMSFLKHNFLGPHILSNNKNVQPRNLI